MANPGDVVAVWEIRLSDAVHRVQVEHGTTSGKRVITVDGEEVFRKNWMFRLVGSQQFLIGKKQAEISIKAKGMSFEYTLEIDGKSLKRFIEAQARNTRTWLPTLGGEPHRVVLEIDTMEVYADGEKLEVCGEFTDDGTETHFTFAGQSSFIKTVSSGNKRKGLVYTLMVGGNELLPVKDEAAVAVDT